jgi:hypothetical protein
MSWTAYQKLSELVSILKIESQLETLFKLCRNISEEQTSELRTRLTEIIIQKIKENEDSLRALLARIDQKGEE